MKAAKLLRYPAPLLASRGPVLTARLPHCFIGEICEIRNSWRDSEIIARAQVLGFNADHTLLGLTGSALGLSARSVVVATGRSLTVNLSAGLAGAVIDPAGQVIQRLCDPQVSSPLQQRAVLAPAPTIDQRVGIRQPLYTGIRAIDGLLTCGIGQRIGIFSPAGCGKTTLLQMLLDNSQADICVVALVGERGREATEFIEDLRQRPAAGHCVLVCATSDYSSIERRNAALVATTVAEYFRDQGKQVLLLIDSVTRYARALRDVALSAGELPARRGYPASVFDALPALLERPGRTRCGSISAFYTILLESDEEPDPIADEIRSILDGHIYLSPKLTAASHYPAIDVPRSLSRVAAQICSQHHLQAAGEIRQQMARFDELQIFVELGEYQAGSNPDSDRIINRRQSLMQWLRQAPDERCDFDSMLAGLRALAAAT